MPLLFTNQKNGKINAAYTGRFAFVRGVNSKQADSFVKNQILRCKSEIRLQEELQHSRTFIKCHSGLILSALRWLARIGWLATKSNYSVILYYKLRTLFFAHMYSLHESTVASILYDDEKTTLSSSDLRALRARDKLVLKEWQKVLGYKYGLLVLCYPLLYLMGYLTTKDFTIISFKVLNGKLVEKNSAESGFLNNIGSVQKRKKIDSFLKYLIVENWANKGHKENVKWLQEKFKTEKSLWDQCSTILSDDAQYKDVFPSYEEYCFKVADFVLDWSCCTKVDSCHTFTYFLVEPNDDEAFNQLLTTEDEHLKKAIDYFYYHGN